MATQFYQKGVQYHRENDLEKAVYFYKKNCESNPKHFETLFLIGTCFIQLNDTTQAILYLKKALNQRKNDRHTLMNLGAAYRKMKDFKSATQYLKECLKTNPRDPDVLNNLGATYEDQGLHSQSIKAFSQALSHDPSNETFKINRARALIAYRKLTKALSDLKQISVQSPHYFQAQYEIFNVLIKQNNFSEAIKLGESLIANSGQLDHIRINKKLIECSMMLSQIDKANLYLKKLSLNDPDYKFYQALIYQKLSRNEKAMKIYQELIRSGYRNASIYQNLGYEFASLGQHKLAQNYYTEAINIDENHIDSRINLGISQLSCGNFIEGWKNILFVHEKSGSFLELTKFLPLWDGKNNTSRVLIFFDQGLGDQIFYSQLLAKIINYKNRFTIMTDKRLITIYQKILPNNFSFLAVDQQFPIGDVFDYCCSGIGLGKLFIKSSNDLINSNQLKLTTKEPIIESSKLIGISWFSQNPVFGLEKSLSLDKLFKNLSRYRKNFNNLQYGDFSKELTEASKIYKINIDGVKSDNLNDLDQLMDAIANCHQVITIDNTTAHLAGAMGIETILLLNSNHQCHSWYWSLTDKNNHSLWYPSIEIRKAKNGQSLDQVLQTLKL
ncbi:TPR repeat [Methylophilales bacterium HTCC2181]|uniref:TPR repeat n=1 Tax=Methylophilales bacterium HTCC2181 TaxID=383631 RepID=A0P5B6_9PROT|nr:TPR repeat [Methylophilales bacterium HTCC2181]